MIIMMLQTYQLLGQHKLAIKEAYVKELKDDYLVLHPDYEAGIVSTEK